jgi:hypothetical protein
VPFINCAFVLCLLQHRGAVAAHDPAGEAPFLQGEPEGAADEAGADDCDLANCHLRFNHGDEKSRWPLVVGLWPMPSL